MAGYYNRSERFKGHRAAYDRNRKKILATQEICALCGKPVDKSLIFPHPLSPTVDHIIPVDKGGHPSDLGNLQLAHFNCNRQKSDKLVATKNEGSPRVVDNRNLPQSMDWTKYRAKE